MAMDIYDYIHEFLRKLDKLKNIEISRKFRELSNNADKVKLLYNVLEEHNVLSDYKYYHEKNNDKSIEHRKCGNTYFSLKNKDYPRALEYYNKSICYAELNTECLAIGYANRSAIYFEWKMYTICLENIELAFKSCASMPDKLREKLMNRKTSCLDNINDNKLHETLDGCDAIKLTYPAHATVPFIVDCLVMDCNDQFGRYIKTTRDLYPGDCIAIESPSVAILVPEQIYKRCAHCLIENKYSLIPCPNCTATMYCSVKCLDSAYTNSHRFECSASNGLNTLFNKIHLTALNVVLKLFSNLNFLDKTLAYLNDDLQSLNVYNFDYTKASYDYADEYKLLHNLVTNESVRDMSDLFQRAGIAAILYKFVKTNKYLNEIFMKSTVDCNYENLFLKLLFHNLQTAPSNFHSIDTVDIQNDNDLTYGTGAYPFGSLINHSCAPNVVRFDRDRTRDQILIVFRNISSGEQIFDNYGYHHCLQPRDVRQNSLQQYNFKCICEACCLDYPMYHELKLHPHLPHIITENVKEELYKYNRNYARKLSQILFDYLKKYDKLYPMAQICDAQEALKMCLLILWKETPLQGIYKN